MRSLSDFRPYQHAALAFAGQRQRSYLAAKAGAGKTGVALALVSSVLHDQFLTSRVLVVAPKRVAQQWPSEARNWVFSAHLSFSVYIGSPKNRKAALEACTDVLACSFEFFPELVRGFKLQDWPFGLVIFDEASRLRQGGRNGSVGWKAMNAVSAKTDALMLLMSGSPRPGSAHELFAPMALLDRGARLGTTLGTFRGAYLEPNKQNKHSGQVYSWKLRTGMERELYDRVADLYFAVAPDLGIPSVVVDRPVLLSAELQQACLDLQRDQVLDLDELELIAPNQGTVAGKLCQISQGACFDEQGSVTWLHDEKLDELGQIIEELDAPVVVAYWYTHDLARLQKRFPSAVDISTDEGMAAAKAGKVNIALLHPAAAGHGVDGLQLHFSAIVWFALPSSFELYDQPRNNDASRSRCTAAT